MNDHFYFAYGSNMDPARVAERGIVYSEIAAGRAPGYVLRFDKQSRTQDGAGHANIAFARSGVVEGLLYRLESADEIVKMDPFERAPVNYSREMIRVESGAGTCWAWTYFANSAVIAEGLRPPDWYMNHLLAGAEFLSESYVKWLRSFDCLDG